MVSVRFRTSGQDVRLAVSRALSPERRRELIAAAARRGLAESQEINRAALGTVPPHRTFVDGRPEAALDSVNPDRGVIVFQFQLFSEVLEWVDEQLIIHSPVLTERYARSHVLFVDGIEADPRSAPAGSEYVFLNTQPYARKIERGQSKQAPDGVYEGVATLAARRFGNVAAVRFGYQSPLLSYVQGARNRDERQALRSQPARQSAMRLERASRVPAIILRMR